MRKRMAVGIAAACLALLTLAGTAAGASAGSQGTWTVFNLSTTGSTEASFVRFGHPLEFSNAKCFSFYYRATLSPLYFALRVAGNSPARVAVLESPSLPPAPIKSTKLKDSPVGAALAFAAEGCDVPLEDWL